METSIKQIPQENGKYTIITTWVQYGQQIQQVEKEYVRRTCEFEKSRFEYNKKHYTNTRNVHMQIEVINNQTGETREFWNSQDNEINF